MQRKKVLFILPRTKQGGSETQLRHLLAHLDKKAFEPYLGLLYNHEQLQKEFFALKGTRIVHFNKKGKRDIGVYWRIATFARKNNIDLICTFMGNHHAYIPALLVRKPAIGGVRNMALHDMGGWKRWTVLSVQKFLTRFINYHLVANSFEVKNFWLQKGFPEKSIFVIPNGIDGVSYTKGNKRNIVDEFSLRNKFVITYVGRLIESKNHEALLRAFPKLLVKKKNAVLLIVGDGPLQQHLDLLINELDMVGKIMLTGNRKDVNDILSASDLFVFPSRTEAWPNVVGEAMAAGLPVVAYPVGDVPRIINQGVNGLITKPNMQDFMKQASALALDVKRRKTFARKAKDTIKEQFSIKKMVASFQDVFTKVLEEKQ